MLAEAFLFDPLCACWIEDVQQRRQLLPCIFQVSLRLGVLYGEAWSISKDLEAIAVWHPPAPRGDWSLWAAVSSGSLFLPRKVGEEVMHRIRINDQSTRLARQRHAPMQHWYLSPLGVDPSQQRQGFAGELLRSKLVELDRNGQWAYLETHNEQNLTIYQKFGFQLTASYEMAELGIKYWCLLRPKSES